MRNWIFKRRLPKKFGSLPIYVSPDAQLKVLKPGSVAFDPQLLNAVDELVDRGDTIWDVGANMGVFSLASAYRSGTGKVVAIEADLWLVNMLRKTFELEENRSYGVEVLPIAASNRTSIQKFLIARRGRASNHLDEVTGSTQSGGARSSALVPTFELDSLLAYCAPPSVVKIDVEGAENLVLDGMTKILSTIRPKLYCEVTSDKRKTLEIMERYNYSQRGSLREHGANLFFNPK
ncbi:FkbM family methyltransferase [Mesorhizobium sp. M0751]|uniref:FkbM family methyltransferase n=1 Tax=unclassified Mesorhizobium TaxID=325217 RepID=UPI00333DB860